MIKPHALRPGDKVAIVSLSNGILGEPFCSHYLELGTRRLQEFGLEPVFMPNALKGMEYLKQHPEARAADLKAAFMDESIRGIIAAIGGDDTYHLLPYLMADPEFVRQVQTHPKLFTGFSDSTINHLMFHRLGMVSFYGPNYINDLSEMADGMLSYTKQAFNGYLSGEFPLCSSPVWYEERTDFSPQQLGIDRVCHPEHHGFEVIQGSGIFRGQLLGGCLESFYDILTQNRYPDQKQICETYRLFPSKEEWGGKALFLETCEERPTPELLAKELTVLKEQGVFDVISGILVGKPQNEIWYKEYKEIYRQVIDRPDLPILYNLNFGHAYPRMVLPYGIEIEVNMDTKQLQFCEPIFEY